MRRAGRFWSSGRVGMSENSFEPSNSGLGSMHLGVGRLGPFSRLGRVRQMKFEVGSGEAG